MQLVSKRKAIWDSVNALQDKYPTFEKVQELLNDFPITKRKESNSLLNVANLE